VLDQAAFQSFAKNFISRLQRQTIFDILHSRLTKVTKSIYDHRGEYKTASWGRSSKKSKVFTL
jgi:hypothetical protein